MDEAARDLRAWRKRVARMVQRAEAQPGRGALLLRGDVGELLADLKRLARAEPAVVLEVLLFLMERLSEVIGELDDGPGFAAGLVPDITERLKAVMVHDATTGENRVDHAAAVERLLRLWIDDGEGWYQDLDTLLIEVSVAPAAVFALRSALLAHISALPLVFPPPRGAEDDVGRALLLAERHRSERLMGELLARGDQTEYAIIVARDHYRRTGDALDLARSLHRAGRNEEAIIVCRKALASPRAFQRQRIQELLDEMLEGAVTDQARETRKELERIFIADPSAKSFAALKKSVSPDQWTRVRRRVLGHLQKHQKAPTLVFQLYVDEGEITEADGLVVVQPVDADVLADGAERIASEHASKAAGWLLFAAHHRMKRKQSAAYTQVLRDLARVRELAESEGQLAAFHKALTKFRARYASRRAFLKRLDALGLMDGIEDA